MKFYFSTPVWNNNHTDLFTSVCLPSLLTPNNLPILKEFADCKYIIHTTARDKERIQNSLVFAWLSGYMNVEFRDVGNTFDKYRAMSDCHREVIMEANQYNAPIVFVPPDTMWSDRTFKVMEEKAEAGKTVFYPIAVRVTKAFGDSVRRGWIDGAWSNRGLVQWALTNLHRLSNIHFWNEKDGNVGTEFYPSNMYWKVANEGVLAHIFHMHPLMVNPEKHFVSFGSTIDDDFIVNACPDTSRHYVVQDSDECVGFELSPDGQQDFDRVIRKESVGETILWMQGHTNKNHRQLVKIPIFIHSTEMDTDLWARAVVDARTIVEQLPL